MSGIDGGPHARREKKIFNHCRPPPGMDFAGGNTSTTGPGNWPWPPRR